MFLHLPILKKSDQRNVHQLFFSFDDNYSFVIWTACLLTFLFVQFLYTSPSQGVMQGLLHIVGTSELGFVQKKALDFGWFDHFLS